MCTSPFGEAVGTRRLGNEGPPKKVSKMKMGRQIGVILVTSGVSRMIL